MTRSSPSDPAAHAGSGADGSGSGGAPSAAGPFLESALALVCHAALAVLGAAAGLAAVFAAGWLSRYWGSGLLAQGLAIAALALFLVLLYTGVRAAGWGSGSRLGAGLFTAGWAAALLAAVGYVPGGDVIMTAAAIDQFFLFGSLGALALAVVRTPPKPRTPAAAGRGR